MDKFCGSIFLDSKLTWYTEDPEFTPCFEKTVLVWIPCGFLWLFAPFDIYSTLHTSTKQIPWHTLNLLKCTITGIIIVLQLLGIGYFVHQKYFDDIELYPVDEFTPFFKLVTFIHVILLQFLHRKHGIRSSGLIFLFWLLLGICELPIFRTAIRGHQKNDIQLFPFVIEMIFFPLILLQIVLHFWADRPPIEDRNEKGIAEVRKNECPHRQASFISRQFFLWFSDLAKIGYQRPLQFSDLWDLNYKNTSRNLNETFKKYWNKGYASKKKFDFGGGLSHVAFEKTNNELFVNMKISNGAESKEISKGPKKTISIIPIIFKAFRGTFIAGALYHLATVSLQLCTPMILNQLIAHVRNVEEEVWKGYFYAVLLFIVLVLVFLFGSQYYYRMMLVGMRIKSMITTAIYEKSLKLSSDARGKTSVGELSLLTVDAQRLSDLSINLNSMWSCPFQITVAFYLLWDILGPSVFVGIGVMVLLIPINAAIGAKVKNSQVQQMQFKDKRIKLTSEILSGIKVIKLYGWETSFEEQITKVRSEELAALRKSAFLSAILTALGTCAPFMVSLATFATFVYVDEANVLDAQKAFVSLTLFNIMKLPLDRISSTIVFFIQAAVSTKRINEYLNSNEIDESAVTRIKSGESVPPHMPLCYGTFRFTPSYQFVEDAILIQNGNFAYGKETGTILKEINLNVKEGTLVAVVGVVGSGKSTLVSAILGEIPHSSGRINTKGRIAYVSQQAWIQNATVRENILFGLPYDRTKYRKIVEACALGPDLEILPAGDQTEIGEKGINLSGGQKQRVALARATYNDADIYILDDPLSAVDSHVGKHLFEHVLGPNGLLKCKTRLLVTHNVTFLRSMDNILVLKDEKISENGTYQELLDKRGAFADFLIEHMTNEDGEMSDSEVLSDLEDRMGSTEVKRRLSQASQSDRISELGRRSISKRKTSTLSQERETKAKGNAKLIQSERLESGNMKLSIFIYYLREVGWLMSLLIFMFQILYQGFAVSTNKWLSDWSSAEGAANGTEDSTTRDMYLGVYAGLGLGQAISILTAAVVMAIVTLKATGVIHWKMLNRVLKAPMSFFDTTPSGRIVNRFAKDVETTDNAIPLNFANWLNYVFSVIAALGVISYSTPIFMVVILPLGLLYSFAQRYYVASIRQLRRLESVSRSPVYSHFSETLSGSGTIRAFGVQDRFMREFEAKVDKNQISYFPTIVANRYVTICMELTGNIIVLFSALFAVMARKSLSPGLVGLSVSYALQMTALLNWLVKMTNEVETNFVSVERLKEYGEVDQEAERESPQNQKPGKDWPERGEIIFDNYQTRYRPDLDLVLNGITCKVEPKEKVGIIGRTGAGKSSLTLALFRIIESAGGSIEIDGKNIFKLGLHDLRRRLTIIPQEPVIFSGSLRMNLDPFGEYQDQALWQSLEQAHLKSFVISLGSIGLYYELQEGGENLSIGQRQLVCLARALLRKTRILVLDEATAAVDLDTDDIIQATIRREFKDSTILTIAHRLNTIMDYTRVMVLDKGVIREFDSPASLLQDKNSLFYAMAKDAGLV